MKGKTLKITVAILVLALLAVTFVACDGDDVLEGKYIVTFQFNGGLLNTGSTIITGQIQHAYQPNSYAIDISVYRRYTFTRNGYVFDGWYTEEDCTNRWNFATDRVSEDITLYAKWRKAIEYSYTVCYIADGQTNVLGKYVVEEGSAFEDIYNYADLTKVDKTFVGFYADEALTQPWNQDFVHPGGEESTDILVYIKWKEGVWRTVSTYAQLKAATNCNIELAADIDCEGNELYFGDFDKVILGNNHKICNFRIKIHNDSSTKPEFSIFGQLKATARVENVSFENVVYDVTQKVLHIATPQFAALAQSAEEGCVISNVHVSGTYEITSPLILQFIQSGDIPPLDFSNINNAFFDSESQQKVSTQTFSADIQPKDAESEGE